MPHLAARWTAPELGGRFNFCTGLQYNVCPTYSGCLRARANRNHPSDACLAKDGKK